MSIDLRIGNELPKVETKARVSWGYKSTSGLGTLHEDIIKLEKKIEPHKIYVVLFLDKSSQTPAPKGMEAFAAVLKSSLILAKGLYKPAVEIIKSIEVTPKLLDESRILVTIDVKTPELRERIKDFAEALVKSQPDSKEEKGALELQTSFTATDLLLDRIDYEKPTYLLSFQGHVDRDMLEILKTLEIPEELKAYLPQIQLLLLAKSAKLNIKTHNSMAVEFFANKLEKLRPKEKIKLPKMPIIKKILGIGRDVLCAKIQVVFSPESFLYEMEASTSNLISLIDELCLPPS